ncbi:carbohydrate kinase family protein [Aestuariivirga sp.]|uniref:carbohydrate kinase family protein n=1 Tax=Aestuariivirga sp. TaxID=2650926 RepID=UPI00391A2A65
MMARVIVIGGANVDIKGRCGAPYVSGTSNPGDVTVSPGGVGRNIADNLARLGIAASLFTVLGKDANGEFLRTACAAAGIDLSHTVTSDAATGTYLAVLDDTGEMVSAVSDMHAIEGLAPAHLEAAASHLAAADMLVADCNIPVSCLAWLCAFAADHGRRLLIEPVSVAKSAKLLQFERAQPVFAVTPNMQQLAALAGGDVHRLHERGFANVVVHRGGKGALASDGQISVEVAPLCTAAAVADVTGAGDAAVAGLVCGLVEGRTLVQAARLGQAAAASKISSRESVAMGLARDRVFRLAGLP